MKTILIALVAAALICLPSESWARRRWIPAQPAAAPSGIALVAHAIAGSGGTSSATTAGVNTSGANFLVVVAVDLAGGSQSAISDSYGNTPYLQLTSQSATVRETISFYYSATVGAGHTFTASGGTVSAIAAAAFSGVLTTNPVDVQAGTNNSGSATIQPGSITPTQNNELIISGIGGYVVAGSETYSIDSGMTITDQQGLIGGASFGLALAYKVQTTAAAINPTWTVSSSAAGLSATNGSFKAP